MIWCSAVAVIKASLPGKLGDQISDAIVSASVKPFGAARCVPPKRDLECVCIVCPSGGFCHIFVLCPGQGIPISGRAPVERPGQGGRSPTCRASNGAIPHVRGNNLVVLDCPLAGCGAIGVEACPPVRALSRRTTGVAESWI